MKRERINNNRRVTPTMKCEPNHINKALLNQQRSKRGIEHRFRIVKQLPFHFAPQRIRG